MILETKARYFVGSDSIQVAILLQEDDYTSAAPSLKTGTVEILFGDTAMYTELFYPADKVLWFNGNTNYDTPEDRGQFYFFVHHPAAQQNMYAKVSVVMSDDRTATQRVPIDAQTQDVDWQNPMLPNRDPIEYEKDPSFPYRAQE